MMVGGRELPTANLDRGETQYFRVFIFLVLIFTGWLR
jgi:hypothetical protein